MASASIQEYISESEGGRLYDIDGVALVDLRGDWHTMGRQYGSLVGSRLQTVLHYLDYKFDGNQEKRASAIDIAEKLYANYPDHLKDFFDGVSETSSIGIDQLKFCNAVEYVEGCFFCSCMAAWGDYASGKLVVGRNYDAVSYRYFSWDVIVTVYHPDGCRPAATVGYAGEIYCINGLNEKGLFIELNNGTKSAGDKIHWELCPGTTELFEQLFKAESLDDMDRFFHDTRCFTSFIIGVADSREARSYEWCYDGVRRGDMVNPSGLMVCTNHYVNDQWPYPVPADANCWNSLTRRRNILRKAEQYKGSIDVHRAKKIMSRPLEDGGPYMPETRYQIIAVPEDLTLHINLPRNDNWVEINLGKFFND